MAESSRRYNLRDTRKKPQGVLLKRWEVEYSKLINNENRRIPLETVKTAIRSAFKDGMFEQWRITLKCQLSGQRIKVPARYADCTHIECFDLEYFLRMKTQKNLLVCPICQKQVEKPLANLRIDKYIETVMSTMPDAMQVELLPDGSFAEVHEEFVVVPTVINDEEPYVQDSNTPSFDVKQEVLQDEDEYITLSDGEDESLEAIAIVDMKPISLMPLYMDIKPKINSSSELEQIHSGEGQEIQEVLEDDDDYITLSDGEDESLEEIAIVDMKPISLMPLNMDIKPKINSSSELEQIHPGEDQETQDQHHAGINENDQDCSTSSAAIIQYNVKIEPEDVNTSEAKILGITEMRKRKAASIFDLCTSHRSEGNAQQNVKKEGEGSELGEMEHIKKKRDTAQISGFISRNDLEERVATSTSTISNLTNNSATGLLQQTSRGEPSRVMETLSAAELTNKILVCGPCLLPEEVDPIGCQRKRLQAYFSRFGKVLNVTVIEYDNSKVSFDNCVSAAKCIQQCKHIIGGQDFFVYRADPTKYMKKKLRVLPLSLLFNPSLPRGGKPLYAKRQHFVDFWNTGPIWVIP